MYSVSYSLESREKSNLYPEHDAGELQTFRNKIMR